VFRLESHLRRLVRSLEALAIDWQADSGWVREEIDRLLAANVLSDARVRITVTGGLSDGSLRLQRSHPPTVLIMAGELATPPSDRYERGIDLAVAGFRQRWSSPLARIKTIHRLEYLMAREEALRKGADDALILDDRGQVAECSSSNIFLFLGDVLVTPSLDSPILPGVTREVALEAAAEAGIRAVERSVEAAELGAASEIFVTATSYEILPVRAIDGQGVGAGGLGPRTILLHRVFREIVAREIRGGTSSRPTL
jgi:branched-chain amino acid aminotransferase